MSFRGLWISCCPFTGIRGDQRVASTPMTKSASREIWKIGTGAFVLSCERGKGTGT